ncbi:MAG: MBL fold metallo-hydrolase, partial [Promethearchaeia archaeon]
MVILGSGGGRHHIRTQFRATGGFLYKFNGIQAHIDPGPGAIVRLNQYGEDPTKTELFIVTHVHLDHFSDLGAVIESSREQLHDKNHTYYRIGTLVTAPDVLPLLSNYHKNMLEAIVPFEVGKEYVYKDVRLTGTMIKHSDVDGFGVRFDLDEYCLAYTSDTTVFRGFAEQFNDVDIMILNLLRPDSVTCSRHLCTDQVIPYLNRIKPTLKALIITHFGTFMDGPFSEKNNVPSQITKLKRETKIPHVIAAHDGLTIPID